jgi:hypothetical protein
MNTPREDGPAIAKLFTAIDGPASFKEVMPASLAGMVGAPGSDYPIHDLGLRPIMGDDPVQGPLHGIPLESLGRDAEDQGVNTDGDPEDEGVVVGPINYAHKLHQAGEAAIGIVCNMCEAEFAGGNPNNMPEPILGWYVLTLSYQLCVLEAVEQPVAPRLAHAQQLRAALIAFKRHHGPYAQAVRADVGEVLRTRFVPAALAGEDLGYGDTIPAPSGKVPT